MFRTASHEMFKLKLLGLLRPLMVAGMILLGAGVVHAATYTYTGNSNTYLDSNGSCAAGGGGTNLWSDPRNWAPPCGNAGPPGPGDSATIGDFTVNVDTNVTVGDLTFSPAATSGNAIYVSNNATLTSTGTFTWIAGGLGNAPGYGVTTPSGTFHIAPGGQWVISGAADKRFSESFDTVINDGSATWSGGNIHLYQSGNKPAITNNGTFTATTDASLIEDTAIGLDPIGFVNNGTFRKTGGGGITNVSWAFTNHGLVDAQMGSIALAGGIENGGMNGYAHIHDGTFNAAAGATG
ncbi:MAG: hypothetical protein JO316_07340 [Abitibacteriaceae bacterium]|nr:hypothetical protein [Abditibacteriaceae bacterium]MBV9865149.1 hypothetical protein [Abditibacteriaceae bacterium]